MKQVILGSVTANFQVTIKTVYGWITLDKINELTFIHECGYTYNLVINPSLKHEDVYAQN